MILQMRDNSGLEALLSDRSRQITCLPREDNPEKMQLVLKSWWSLRDTAKAVEQAAHTLLLVLSAAYTISIRCALKASVMKVIVYDAHKAFCRI